MDVLFDTCRTHIAYIKKAYLTTRNDCARLGRKFINFSKVPNFYKAAIICDRIFIRTHKSLGIEIPPLSA